MTQLFAITTRGLETVSAAEMARLPGVQVGAVSYRKVCAKAGESLSALLDLRTVDDVFLDLAAWTDILPQRSMLAKFTEWSGHLRLEPALQAVAGLRKVGNAPDFSVTVNFVGKRNYSADEIKIAVADGIVSRYPWAYTSEDRSAINIRVFIEHAVASVGMRLGAGALHSRSYKQAHISGSLKPSVAAAMLEIGEVQPGMRLLDPMCGAGTIVIEAARCGAEATGGDSGLEALAAAAANAQSAGLGPCFARWDAQRLPLASGSVERIVCNLPWDRQVVVDENIAIFYRKSSAEMERLLGPGGQALLLTSLPNLVQFERLTLVSQTEISLFGQTPVIMRFA